MTKVARWIAIGALFIIPFIPLYVASTLFFPFITGKGFAFRILVEVAACAWVVLALANKRYRPRFSWTLALFTAFTVWMAIADAFAVNPHKAFWSNFERMDGWVTLIHVFLLFVVAGSVLSVDTLWRKWWLTFIGAASIVCAYGVLQMTGFLTIHQSGARVDATFGNSEYLAAYLLFVIAIAIWQAMESKGWLRYTLYAASVLGVVVLFATATRGAVLGLIGAGVLGAILWMVESGKKTRGAAAGVLIALLVLAGGFYLAKDSAFVRNDPTLARIATISVNDGSTRFTLWHMAYEGFLERPITGWGQEGFNYVFNKFYVPSLYSQEAWFDRAHDIYIDWLVAGGLPALLLFLALMASAVVALYRANVSRAERVMLVSALAAYLFQAIFVFDNLFTYVPLVMLLAAAHVASSRPIKALEDAPEVSEKSVDTVLAPLGLIAAIVLIWIVNVPNVKAAGDLVHAITPTKDQSSNLALFNKAIADHSFGDQEIREQLVYFAANLINNAGVSADTKSAFSQLAITEMGKEVAAAPKDARLRIEYALIYRALGDYKNALVQVNAALALSPKKQTILTEKGIDQLQSGDVAGARDTWARSYALDPGFPQLAAYVAAGDVLVKDIDGAHTILQKAYGTTTVDSDILMVAYFNAKDFTDLINAWKLRVVNNKGDAQSMFGLAAAYAEAGMIPQARAQIQATIVAHPEASADGTAFLQSLSKM